MTDNPSRYFVIGSVVVFVGDPALRIARRPRWLPDGKAGRHAGPDR